MRFDQIVGGQPGCRRIARRPQQFTSGLLVATGHEELRLSDGVVWGEQVFFRRHRQQSIFLRTRPGPSGPGMRQAHKSGHQRG